jgi:hypothetical protein
MYIDKSTIYFYKYNGKQFCVKMRV